MKRDYDCGRMSRWLLAVVLEILVDKSGGGSLHLGGNRLISAALASKGRSLDITRRSTIQIRNIGLKTVSAVDIWPVEGYPPANSSSRGLEAE